MGNTIESEQLITAAGIPSVDSQNETNDIEIIEKSGVSIGVMSFNMTDFNWGKNNLGTTIDERRQAILDRVKPHVGQTDWLIVSLHWGYEGKNLPEAWQIEFAHELIDAGVNIIAGTHPHQIQEPFEEEYNSGRIYYSLGNVVFDQPNSKATSTSKVVRLTVTKNQILSRETFDIEMDYPSGQPRIVQ